MVISVSTPTIIANNEVLLVGKLQQPEGQPKQQQHIIGLPLGLAYT